MKLSDYIAQFIRDKGIETVFGYIGGAITHLVDSIYQTDGLKFVQVYHEQTASFAIEGYSRNSNKVGIALSTSGPGATNLITGIGDAYFDSIPCIFITGQVNTYEYKYDKEIRQQGFQETDIVAIVKPVVKYAVLLDNPQNIRYELEKAFFLAQEGRPGPVLLDIPLDIQRAEIDPETLSAFSTLEPENNEFETYSVLQLIKNSKRPLILAGGGLIASKAQQDLLYFAKKYNIPVVTSLMGKGSFPENEELYVGYIGSYGHRCANIVLANADLLLALGTRLSTRQTGTALTSFMREGKIIHIDIDANELKHHRLNRELKLNVDARVFLKKIAMNNDEVTLSPEKKYWLDYIKNIKSHLSHRNEVEKYVPNKIPYQMLEQINQLAKPFDVFTADIGHNQIIAVQSIKLTGSQKFFTSGGMAPMGYAIPVAIGASFACGHTKRILAIVGDGGFHISLQALMLLSQYRLPIKVLILNNKSLGMIVQFQDLYFGKREYATTRKHDFQNPDFQMIAGAYNLKYHLLTEQTMNNQEVLKSIFDNNDPAVIELDTKFNTTVSPKLEVNHPIEDTSPKLSPEELCRYMIIKPYEKDSRL